LAALHFLIAVPLFSLYFQRLTFVELRVMPLLLKKGSSGM
jgi:hypothetical protein